MEREEVTVVDVAEGEGNQILFTQQGVWIPKDNPSVMKRVPDLAGIMLGATLNRRKSSVSELQKVDMDEIISESNEPWELERRLRSIAVNVPYTSIIRCYLARAGRLSRPKLAFDYFDERSLSVVTCEFKISEDSVTDLEGVLGDLISDRLEVH